MTAPRPDDLNVPAAPAPDLSATPPSAAGPAHPGLISVILSTYNQPAWLEKVLWGYAVQRDRQFELLVADDGSGPETRDVIERLSPVLGIPVRHVWQEDDGFRKCRILNRAVLASRGDYLVFSDGDCIPPPWFVGTHRRAARPGHYASGILLRLDMAVSQRITVDDVRSGRAASWRWLHRNGVPLSTRLLRFASPAWVAALADRYARSAHHFAGCNSSVWRTDLEAVNGFEERLGYGAEDAEFGFRLRLAGVRPVGIRNRAPVLHLEHDRAYLGSGDISANLPTIAEVTTGTRRRALVGLDAHVSGDAPTGVH